MSDRADQLRAYLNDPIEMENGHHPVAALLSLVDWCDELEHDLEGKFSLVSSAFAEEIRDRIMTGLGMV